MQDEYKTDITAEDVVYIYDESGTFLGPATYNGECALSPGQLQGYADVTHGDKNPLFEGVDYVTWSASLCEDGSVVYGLNHWFELDPPALN